MWWIVLGFVASSAVGVAAALAVARRGEPRLTPPPWNLYDMAKQHVPIMGGLAGFSITGIVILVGLARSQPGLSAAAMDTVVVMFFVSFIFYISNAFLLSYIPSHESNGEIVYRVHFSLASTMEYRTIFLSWFALMPLLQMHGLMVPASILAFVLPLSLLSGTLVIAMVADSLGLITFKESYVLFGIGTVLVLALAAGTPLTGIQTQSDYSTLTVSLLIFCLNGLSFAVVGLSPLASRYPRVREFLTRHGRSLVVIDMLLTTISQMFLWLAVASFI